MAIWALKCLACGIVPSECFASKLLLEALEVLRSKTRHDGFTPIEQARLQLGEHKAEHSKAASGMTKRAIHIKTLVARFGLIFISSVCPLAVANN